MSLLTFNDIHSSCDAALIFAIYITYYIVRLKSYFAEIFFYMDTPFSLQMYWQYLRAMILRTQQMNSGMLKPAYPCDVWHQEKRVCLLSGNIGNTVTFVLAAPPPQTAGRIRIEWFQGFSYSDASAWEKNKTYQINPKDPPWNMVIGSGGRELRISPITESDINENYFTAVAHFQRGTPIRKLHFAIQVMPTDIGVVYPGDTVTIHMPSYVSLPAESMIYKWHLEREPPSLSSNMQASRSGASLMISELRKEQEGILTCRVFTNIGIFATQKRFLIKNVESENSKLIFIATRPPHKFVPLAEWNAKLGQLLESIPKIFGKRDSRTSPNDTDRLDPQRLKQFLSKMPELKKYLTENYNLTIKRKKRSPQPLESLDYFIEPVDSRQADANVITDFNSPNEQPQLPFDTRSLNKRQDDYTAEIEDFTPEIEDFEAPMVVESKEYHPNEKDEPETINTPKQGYFGDFDYIEDVRFEQEALDVETPPPQPTQRSKPLSFLEQHRQAILSRLYTSKPRRKQMKKISKTRFRTTTATPEMLDEEGTSLPLQERDIIAMLLSECNRDSQCSLNAECVKRKKSKPGFCRCRPQFEGNGIFCWENDKYKK